MWAKARWLALHEAMLAEGLESPFVEMLEWMKERPSKDHRLTTRVECGDWFEIRDDALRAHATQVDPDGPWFHVPLEVQQRAWPTEDFQLARSLVESEIPESDLFAGVDERVAVQP